MKSMTCRQMGGSCDTLIYGNTAEEMMGNGAKHLAETNDAEHKTALSMMEDMKNKPEEARKWNEDFVQKFNNLP